MKYGILFIVSLLLFSSCDTSKQEEARNIETVKKYVNAVESGDYDNMAALLADTYVGVGPSVNDSTDKATAVAGWKEVFEVLYTDITYTKSRFLAVNVVEGDNKGNWVSHWAEVKIDYEGDLNDVILMANTVYQLENDQIVKSITFYNEADVMEQLGFVFINPNDL